MNDNEGPHTGAYNPSKSAKSLIHQLQQSLQVSCASEDFQTTANLVSNC